MQIKRIVVTGGAGFIGNHLVRHLLMTNKDLEVITLDALTYAGNLENLANIAQRHTFVHGDICDLSTVLRVMDGADAVLHLAAESHVDRSIIAPQKIVRTNILGTQVLLEAARQIGISKFIQVSTDEVYGTLGADGYFTESTPIAPNSPYSASKAGADLLAFAYFQTYGLPVCITRCSNNYGPNQFPEKLIPRMIVSALHDKPLPIYGDGLNIRDWLHVQDHVQALELVLHAGTPGEVYNIGGNQERTNIEVVREILRILGKDEKCIRFVPDRFGHDRRYGIDASKIRRELGWKPKIDFPTGLADTVAWYVEHTQWWEDILSKSNESMIPMSDFVEDGL